MIFEISDVKTGEVIEEYKSIEANNAAFSLGYPVDLEDAGVSDMRVGETVRFYFGGSIGQMFGDVTRTDNLILQD